MTKFFGCLLVITFLASCASYKDILVNGLERVSYSSEDDPRPSLYYKKHFVKKRNSRSIASVDETSTKSAYFLAMYGQYNRLNQLIGKESTINTCPQFHNELLSLEKDLPTLKTRRLNFASVKQNKKLLAKYSVLGLKYKKNEDVITYVERRNKWDKIDSIVEEAIAKHNAYNEKELQDLCTKGSSNGYYAFTNMISYHASGFQSSSAMATLLKVPTISNMLLLSSYTGNVGPYEKKVLGKLKAEWFTSYLDDLKKEDNHKVLMTFMRY